MRSPSEGALGAAVEAKGGGGGGLPPLSTGRDRRSSLPEGLRGFGTGAPGTVQHRVCSALTSAQRWFNRCFF